MQRRARMSAAVFERVNRGPVSHDKHIDLFHAVTARLIVRQIIHMADAHLQFHKHYPVMKTAACEPPSVIDH
jgi:hypothetical protein